MVTVVQPYITSYRLPLFERLQADLAEAGFDLEVAHGEPWGEFISRHDSVSAEFARPMGVRRASRGRWHIQYRATGRFARRSAVMVAELSSTNVDIYARALGSTPLILWGHGQPMVTRGHAITRSLERWLVRRAAHVFTYSSKGKEYLVKNGLPRHRITVVNNSTDTVSLTRIAGQISEEDLEEFRRVHDLDAAFTVCFVGSLDPTKRIDLLLEAAGMVAREKPEFRMLIAGTGVLRPLVEEEARKRPELTLLPYADKQLLGLIGRASKLMVIPGRVGLVAVDAIALGLPVITTDWPFHAPEREYLLDTFCDVVMQDAETLARQILRRLEDKRWLAGASEAMSTAASELSVEHMSQLMSQVIVSVGGPRRKT